MSDPYNVPNQYLLNLDAESYRNILEDERQELLEQFLKKYSDIEKQLLTLSQQAA